MNKLEKIISFLILSCFIFLFNLNTYAHWINATHEYIIDLAVWHLCQSEEGKFTYENTICNILFIWEDFRAKKLMYRMIMEQGVKDADLRVNGIYAVDGHCKDPAKETCPEGEKIYNDISEWIIGDHGYNPENGEGFYSNPKDNFLDERINDLLKNFHDPKTERLKEALGCQKNDRICFINRLRSIAQKSNAATMAKFFWERAIKEWKTGHEARAMYNLGIAIHIVQDVTVPHHVRLIRDKTHHEYEEYVWETYLKKGDFEPEIEVIHGKLTAEEWVKRNARETYRLNLSPKVSAADSVRLAVSSTVDVINNFFEIVLPKIHVVSGGSIQAAIDSASSGDTIIVHDGTYTENVDVNKSLTILSENGATATIVQAANSDDNIFEVTADYVSICGFTIKGARHPRSGIYLYYAKDCNISNNNILNNGNGIRLHNSTNNNIPKNKLMNNGDGMLLEYSTDNAITNNVINNNKFRGLMLWYSSNKNTVINNTFANDGLFVIGAYQNIVENNTVNGKPLVYLEDKSMYTITDAGQVILVNCNNITIESLNLSNTVAGIELWMTNNSSILNNTISDNRSGIRFYHSSNNVVINNNILDNNWGIYSLAFSKNNRVSYNSLSNNYIGIELHNASNNTISLNNFINNSFNAESKFNSNNIWKSPEEITYIYNGNTYTNYLGNYWSDYTGGDADGDGIGDTPYPIDGNNDNYPLIEISRRGNYEVLGWLRRVQTGWLSFIEGNPGVPGDGVFIDATGGLLDFALELPEPIPLSQFKQGFTITVFFPPNIDMENFKNASFAIINKKLDEPCMVHFGAGAGLPTGKVVFNGVEGIFTNVGESWIQFMVDTANLYEPNCNLTVDDLFIGKIYLHRKIPLWEYITTLDAVAILPGQNAFPSDSNIR